MYLLLLGSGVLQGSHLGPLILFINDDDLNSYLVKLISEHLNLQQDLDMLSLWCKKYCLYLNIGKFQIRSKQVTEEMIIKIHDIVWNDRRLKLRWDS